MKWIIKLSYKRGYYSVVKKNDLSSHGVNEPEMKCKKPV